VTTGATVLRGPGGPAASPEAPDGTKNDKDDLSSLLRWLADQPDPPNVELVCAHEAGPVWAPSDALVVQLDGCAAELSAASYLEAAAGGVAQLTVLASGCLQVERIGTTIAEANRLLKTYPGVCLVACETERERRHRRAHVYDMHRLPVSRRRLLFLARLDYSWMPDVHADQRARSLAALRHLASNGASPSAMHELSAPSAALVATECTACGVCVRACPTGALSLDQTDSDVGAFTLKSLVSRCVDCGRCVSLCPSGVLIRTDQLDWAQLLDDTLKTVATGLVRRCAHCGGNFPGTEVSQYCPPCLFRMENPFRSRGPVSSPKPIATCTGATR
jgi:ferredoxin